MSNNQFRRFTYLIASESINLSEIKNKEKLEEVGIIACEAYQKNENIFLLIDALTHFNSEKLSAVFSKEKINVQDCIQKENNWFSFESSPLERIYKFEQKKVYDAKEGQLKTDIGEKKRFVWTLLLEEDPNLMAEYKRVHSMGQAWPEITANMKTVGVKDMEIYLSGTQAILIMDTIPNFNLDEIGPKWQELPREDEWQNYVAKFQRTDPNSSIQEKWQDMLPV